MRSTPGSARGCRAGRRRAGGWRGSPRSGSSVNQAGARGRGLQSRPQALRVLGVRTARRSGARLSAVDGAMTRRVPVLIVGGGPVGLALAGELGWRGIACELIEQTDGTIVSPKMNEVNARSMEICRRWGIADQVFNCPFPADFPLDVAFVTSLVRLRAEPPAAARAATARQPAPESPHRMQACSQIWFDPILQRVRRLVSERAAAPPLPARCASSRRQAASSRRVTDLASGAARGDRGRLSGRLRRRRQPGAPRARHRDGGAGHHRPSDQSVLPRAGPDRALRQAAGDVLPRHRRDRAVGQPAHHRSGQRPVAADDRFHRRQRHARDRGSRILSAPRARRPTSRSNGSTSTSGGGAARWRNATAVAASGSPATPCTSFRRPAAWA